MSKTAAELAEHKKALRTLMDKANREAKHKVIAFADEVVSPYYLRRPSGIMQLDLDTAGGLPAGGLSFLSGPENAGKSFLLFKYFAQHQKLYGEWASIAYCSTEAKPDYFFMRKCGISVAIPDEVIEQKSEWRKSMGMKTFSKEEIQGFKKQVGTFHMFNEQTAEGVFDTAIAMLRSDLYGILAIDSIAALIPEQELRTEAGKGFEQLPQQAAQASLLTRFMQHYYSVTSALDGKHMTTTIFTNQVRSNRKKAEASSFMQKYIKDWAPTGSWAARHAKLIDICIWGGAKEREGTGDDRAVVGKTLQWELIKGKAGTHDNISGEVDFTYANLVDDVQTMVTPGFRLGVFVEKKGRVSVVRPSTGEVSPVLHDLIGVPELVERLRADPQLEADIRREILSAAGLECAYR